MEKAKPETVPWENLAGEAVGALGNVANALHRLGINDASTPMGAVEILSLSVKEGLHEVASAVLDLADAIRSLRDD